MTLPRLMVIRMGIGDIDVILPMKRRSSGGEGVEGGGWGR